MTHERTLTRADCPVPGESASLAAVELVRELEVARQAAREAGSVILAHYGAAEIEVQTKPDSSPVTAADQAANNVLLGRIRAAFPADGILSEETPDDGARFSRRRVWIIDPLDGTRDFLAQTGDFCVHVGLAVDGVAVLGVVYHPVKDALYYARKGGGAFLETNGETRRLTASTRKQPSDLRVGISRLNPDEGLGKCLAASGLAPRAVQMGASTKHMALARGDLDGVLNLSQSEQEWDTCAPEVVLTEAGCMVTDGDGRPFRYNQKDLFRRRGSVASNGQCHPYMLRIIAPCLIESPDTL
jgi:3'(2'), 5'-bisphosphate nucleotidase